ncbi:MAG: ion transporter [Coriobacteriia bacterium]|nr:ion transporter [Coriobacteriia bacterium]
MALPTSRHRVYEILEVARPGDRASRAADLFIVWLIIANVAAVVLDTVASVHRSFGPALRVFEHVSVAIFTVEYALRLWSAAEAAPDKPPSVTRGRYALSWLAIIDLLAILPAYLPMLLPIDLRTLRLFRLFRLGRLLKVGRYSRAMRTFAAVLKAKKEELAVAIAAVLILLLITSSLMYYAEHDVQPEAFASIPAAMWWGAAALTTVGYGDVYPVTAPGKMLGVMSAVLGIGLFALPAGILASGFSDALAQRHAEDGECPMCGRRRDAA